LQLNAAACILISSSLKLKKVASKINFKKITERLKDAGIMAAGSVASNYADTALAGMLGAKNSPKLNAGIRLAAAALLPSLLGESKKAGMITSFSNGMLAESAVALARAFHVPGVKGTEMDDYVSGYTIDGTENLDQVSGLDA
jgi:hypothetical protein